MIKWSSAKTKPQLKKLYLSTIPLIREVAKKSGYAIGVHGSLTRDLDLIAVPWVRKCVKPLTLAKRVQNLSEYKFKKLEAHPKPHNRIGFVIYIGSNAYIDLSIIPPLS